MDGQHRPEAAMRIHDEQIARNARLRPPVPASQAERAADNRRPNAPPNVQALDESAVLDLQRFAGNAAVTELLADGAARSGPPAAKDEEVGAPRPHFDLGGFAGFDPRRALGAASFGTMPFGAMPDKSPTETEQEQDQSVDVGTFAAQARGLKIIAEASGVFESTDFPDGFKFTQTIETNAPLHGAVSPYVDPHPNDDTKPFYWTDAEQRKYPTTFRDHPSRNPPMSSAVTYWQATLALNGVDEANKTVTGFDYLTYGFIMDAAGNVKLNFPANVDGANHRQTLMNEWSGWTFS
jgi:hypothetical protein